MASTKPIPQDEGCRVACVRSGFDGGKAKDKGCVCTVDQDDYELFVHNRIDLRDFYLLPEKSTEKKRDYYNY